uniref:RNase NYN domain-containing protein n=1 Tax=Stomoxys calcitrans TaxID=35570 RepID=A0A1I8PJY4_STOCA
MSRKQGRKQRQKRRSIIKRQKMFHLKSSQLSPGASPKKLRYRLAKIQQQIGKENKLKVIEISNNNAEPINQNTMDDIPSTSGMSITKSPKKIRKRSPLENAGYVKKFQKIRDDKAKQLLKRSRKMIWDSKKRLTNDGKKLYRTRSVHNKSKSPICNNRRKNSRNSITNSSRNSSNVANIPRVDLTKPKDTTVDSDDDDCILVEKSVTHITIVDDDDDEDNINDHNASTSSCETALKSFSQRFSSTPCGKGSPNGPKNMVPFTPLAGNHPRPSYASMLWNSEKDRHNPRVPGNAPFFIDVNENTFLGHIKYNIGVPLTKNNEDDFVVVDNDTTLIAESSTLEEHNKSKDDSSRNSSSESSGESSSESSSDEKEEGEVSDSVNNADNESVIFVSDTRPNDFIPITCAADKKLTKTLKANNRQKPPAAYSELFTAGEKKQLEVYNTNTYNPNAGEAITSKKRPVIIDGSNVAFKHSLNKGFSVKGLKIAIEYFEKLGHDVKAVIPQFRMNNNKSTDPAELDKLDKMGKIMQTPCKNLPGLTSTSYDDRMILQLAAEIDGVIVSNDNYRDLIHENPAFKKIIESRVIGYTWFNDIFMLPKDPYGKWGPSLDMILNRS